MLFRKLRQDLGITEACGGKRVASGVWFAPARTMNEAAMFVSLFGDMARREGVCDVVIGIGWPVKHTRARAIWEWSM